MTKVTIDRELLERELLSVLDFSESNLRRVVDHLIDVGYTLAAPRQQEGEGLEVVAFYWLDTGYENPNSHGPYFGWPNEDALRRVDGGAMPIALCRLSDHQRAIAELRDMLSGEVETNIPLRQKAFDLTEQRDKLAEILRDIVPGCKWKHMRQRIDAALVEIDNDNE